MRRNCCCKTPLTRYFFFRILQPFMSDTTALTRNTLPPAAANRSRSSRGVNGPLGAKSCGSSPRSDPPAERIERSVSDKERGSRL